jgi:hypothetical protein
MAFRIAHNPDQSLAKGPPPVKSKGYLVWLHELPCLITGRRPVEAAHVNYASQGVGAFGRGKSQKASDRWAVPLHPDTHRAQHDFGDERRWWELQGINPHLAGLVLWGLWKERGNEATEAAERLIENGLGRVVRRSEDG